MDFPAYLRRGSHGVVLDVVEGENRIDEIEECVPVGQIPADVRELSVDLHTPRLGARHVRGRTLDAQQEPWEIV